MPQKTALLLRTSCIEYFLWITVAQKRLKPACLCIHLLMPDIWRGSPVRSLAGHWMTMLTRGCHCFCQFLQADDVMVILYCSILLHITYLILVSTVSHAACFLKPLMKVLSVKISSASHYMFRPTLVGHLNVYLTLLMTLPCFCPSVQFRGYVPICAACVVWWWVVLLLCHVCTQLTDGSAAVSSAILPDDGQCLSKQLTQFIWTHCLVLRLFILPFVWICGLELECLVPISA
jgi:hypothetical protein